MTRVTWQRRAGECRMQLRAEGHAGAGAYGQDIVCAAVSTVMQLLERELRGFGVPYSVTRGPGLMEIAAEGYTAYRLMRTAADFLQAVAQQYPGNVQFEEKILENENAWGENGVEPGV